MKNEIWKKAEWWQKALILIGIFMIAGIGVSVWSIVISVLLSL